MYLMPLTCKLEVKSLSRVRLFATPWTVAYQAPPSMGFSRQGYWSRLSEQKWQISYYICFTIIKNNKLGTSLVVRTRRSDWTEKPGMRRVTSSRSNVRSFKAAELLSEPRPARCWNGSSVLLAKLSHRRTGGFGGGVLLVCVCQVHLSPDQHPRCQACSTQWG